MKKRKLLNTSSNLELTNAHLNAKTQGFCLSSEETKFSALGGRQKGTEPDQMLKVAS